MSIVLFHHPFSRAANALWMLEEVGVPYELHHVDILAGAQKTPEILSLNPMGKLPILKDGETIVTEGAAIALYLADRYSYGTLAPKVDDPARAAYLRWAFFAPSVIEPGISTRASGWAVKESQVGWGNYDSMIAAMESAILGKDFILGKTFSMADVVFGGTVEYMLRVKMLEPRPSFTAYAERLLARPAAQRARARNFAIAEDKGLNKR
ncbi:MAG TPA: glutathione S-transferase [Polyangiaceae bacterium]|nr:glutathione S-transferase [Polyangiaceae bacterium]